MRKVHVGDFKIGDEEKKAVNEVLDSGRISEGEKVREFEREFANFVGTKYSIALSSGTSALIAGLSALKYDDGINVNQNSKIKLKDLVKVMVDTDMRAAGLESIGKGDESLEETFPNRWWGVD